MTKVVNFVGGPGAGKSTRAAELFGWMKNRRFNVEYVSEFAKDLTWKKSNSLEDQLYILGEQHHRLYTLVGQVDWIITDSPLILQLHYAQYGFTKFQETVRNRLLLRFRQLVLDAYECYDNVLFEAVRGDRKYVQAGRNQTEAEAKKIDDDVLRVLNLAGFLPVPVENNHEVVEFLGLHRSNPVE